ncbi:YqaJ viral recombinase family protein [Micromonospora sp. RV43]|uniref:YqaJ viral recombinase family nuclease n=1 Tax=Micromonospora sp. RV43 TaxID=1661387 RepID=UPI00064B8A29|nr:YqaJ viral recombinase family protein [Micromonospora sp. RV43]
MSETLTCREPVLLLPADAPREEWLAARRTGIGGSDVAAVIGISKYDGPLSVFYDKVGVLPDRDTPAMEWGRRLERAVRGKFADQHPELYVYDGPGLIHHAARRWQLATIDGLFAECPGGDPLGIVEVKTGSAGADDWGDELTDQVPLPYLCQTTWYLDVYGLAIAYLCVLLDGRDYREYVIEYDAELAAKLRGHCGAFWHGHVLPGVPPDADALDTTRQALDAQHRPAPKSKADLPAEVVEWARIYGVAHQAEKRAKARKAEAGNHIRAAFLAAGSPWEGRVGGRKVASYPICGQPTKTVTDWDALTAAHPDLVAQFTRTEPVEQERRLILSKEFTQE